MLPSVKSFSPGKTPVAPLTVFALTLTLFLLAGCGIPVTRPESGGEKDKFDRDVETAGKLGGGDGLLNEMIRGRSSSDGGGSGIGVNAFLWQASLDSLSFLPLASADSFGGVIITDWYPDPDGTAVRYKLNVYILGRELRADILRVAVFKQQRVSGQWVDLGENPDLVTRIEDAILTRARQLRIDARQALE